MHDRCERALNRAEYATTPDWWDRDCRCCLGLTYAQRGGRSYHVKGHAQVKVVFGEEIHADHTLEDLILWQEGVALRGY